MFTTKCIHLVRPVQKNILKKINSTLEENTKQMMIVNPFPTGEYNIPNGSVVVTAGGRVLQEGVDYLVNYQTGDVQILNES